MTRRRRSFRTPSGGQGGSHSSAEESSGEAATDNIRVVVRVRPMNEREGESNSIIHVLDSNVLIFDPKPQDSPGSYYHGRRLRQRNLLKRKHRDLKFAFDHVFDEGRTQEYVYQNTTQTVVDSVINGYNASVFAYGATGAGKTHTMLGGPGSPGVIYLTMAELYQRINAIQSEKTCNVTISYLEVYNETIRDLIRPSGPLAIREDPQKGVLVSGLSVHKPKSADELFRMLESGNCNRTQHPTDANKQSSRPHAVFQVFVRQKDRATGLKADVRLAKMSLIDLAGSERATVTSNRGARFREGANINKSLLALGNCINALAEAKSKGHIPYRNSKLTRLLKDSLGGNCKTVMIAAISPSSISYEDTYNTLRYANRTKDIKTSLKRNVVSVNYHVTQYAKIVEELKKENAELKAKLAQQHSQGALTTAVSIPNTDAQMLSRYRTEFDKIFGQRIKIRKELLQLESSDRNLAARIMRKEMLTERLQTLHGSTPQGDKTITRNHRNIATTRKRQNGLREKKTEVERRRQENVAALQRLNAEAGSGGDMKPKLEKYLHSRQMELEVRDSRRLIRHLRQISRFQDRHINSSERLISTLLTVVRKQYYLIKGSGLATEEVDGDFEGVQREVEGTTEVLWADQSTLEESRVGNNVPWWEQSSSSAEQGGLNYLLGLPVSRCEIQSPGGGPPAKKFRRLSFSQSSQSPLVKVEKPNAAGTPPMATPLAVSPPATTGISAMPSVPTPSKQSTPSTYARPAGQQTRQSLGPPLNFKTSPVTGQKMSFAEVVGTPTVRTPVANISRAPFTSLSTNSPDLGRVTVKLEKPSGFEAVAQQGYGNKSTPQHGKVKRIPKDKGKKTAANNHPYRRQSLGPPSRNRQASEYGISMLENTSSIKSSAKLPAYMSLTKSAANKQKGAPYRRQPSRHKENIVMPQRVPILVRSRSSSNVQSDTPGPSGGWRW